MGSVSLTGKDTTIINDRIFKDFADADCVNLEFPNNLVEAKVGKNGNAIYAFNSSGKLVNVKIRIIRGSADDKFLNSEVTNYTNDPAAYTLMIGEFIKRAGDGLGNVSNDTYKLEGGIIQKMPNAKENVSGDTEQAVTEYQIVFTNTDRSI
jgi:hypothetical protein